MSPKDCVGKIDSGSETTSKIKNLSPLKNVEPIDCINGNVLDFKSDNHSQIEVEIDDTIDTEKK